MTSNASRWVWIAVFASAWVIVFVFPWQSLPAMQCPIKAAFGIPCPTCGGIHAVKAMRQGDFGGALVCNPLVGSGLILAAIWAVLLTVVPHFPTPDSVKGLLRNGLVAGVLVMVGLRIAGAV